MSKESRTYVVETRKITKGSLGTASEIVYGEWVAQSRRTGGTGVRIPSQDKVEKNPGCPKSVRVEGRVGPWRELTRSPADTPGAGPHVSDLHILSAARHTFGDRLLSTLGPVSTRGKRGGEWGFPACRVLCHICRRVPCQVSRPVVLRADIDRTSVLEDVEEGKFIIAFSGDRVRTKISSLDPILS